MKNNIFPNLPEEEMEKLVLEMSDPNLLPPTMEEEILLLRILERKLSEGTIKAEMNKNGELWLKTNNFFIPNQITRIKY